MNKSGLTKAHNSRTLKGYGTEHKIASERTFDKIIIEYMFDKYKREFMESNSVRFLDFLCCFWATC